MAAVIVITSKTTSSATGREFNVKPGVKNYGALRFRIFFFYFQNNALK
jgi:hypothetical protein